MRVSLSDVIKNKSIVCCCEGTAEREILSMLMEADRLIFGLNDLLDKQFDRKRSWEYVKDKYLGMRHERQIVILRVMDRNTESFKIEKQYRHICGNYDVCTMPEIEILIIIAENLWQKFQERSNRKQKASEFCKEHLRSDKNIKSQEFDREYFSDIDVLENAIKRYSAYHKNDRKKENEYELVDLLK